MRVFLRGLGLAVVCFAITTTASGPLVSQQEVDVRPNACRGCRVVFTPVARIGEINDPVSLSPFSQVDQDSQGRLYVAPLFQDGLVAVYDAAGEYLGEIGRSGGGPGELRGIRRVAVGPGDSLHVFGRRHSVFTSDGNYVRIAPLPAMPRIAFPLSTGEVLIQGSINTRDRIGFPLHLLATDGSIVRSFGATNPIVRPDNPFDKYRAVAAAGGDRFWSASVSEYRIELWDTAGIHHRTLVRRPEWFPAWTRYDPREPRQVRPRPKIQFIRQDSQGRLWVYLLVADEDWRAAAPAGPEQPINVEWIFEEEKYVDTLIEVIDPQRGELIASARSDGLVHQLLGEDLVVTPAQDEDGLFVLEVKRAQLRVPN